MEGWEGIVQCRLLDDGDTRDPTSSCIDTISQPVSRSRVQRTLHFDVVN